MAYPQPINIPEGIRAFAASAPPTVDGRFMVEVTSFAMRIAEVANTLAQAAAQSDAAHLTTANDLRTLFAGLSDKFSASDTTSLNKFTGVDTDMGGIKSQINTLATSVAELRTSGNKWAADLSNRNSDVDAKLATLTSQIQNSNQMFPNQGTGKGGSPRGLMDKMMIPEIYSDETSAPLTP